MHAGSPPSLAPEGGPPAEPSSHRPSYPASANRAAGAAWVPLLAVLTHLLVLWAAPYAPGLLSIRAPWPLEALLAWLPWASVCAWFLSSQRVPSPGQRVSDALVGAAALVCSAHYVLVFRWTSGHEEWSSARHLSELAAFFSTTWRGGPWAALGYALGLTACAAVWGRAASDLWRWGPRATARRIPGFLALLVFLIGSSALLRYATGSPWPLLGSG